jgi:hypothetical protein
MKDKIPTQQGFFAFDPGEDKMMKRQLGEKRATCEKKVKQRFGLLNPPKVFLVNRKFHLLEDGWNLVLNPTRSVVEQPEYYEDKFQDPVNEFRATFPQLFFDSDRNSPFEMSLLEVRVRLAEVTASAGFSWLTIGKLLRGGGKFCAVCSLFVREMFRDCGISSLLKLFEIDLALSRECSFIQTWHEADSPHFVSAILPSLKTGFVFFHGTSNGGEVYEEEGSIHLRKFFDGRGRYSEVCIQNGNETCELLSPDENSMIIDHLVGLSKMRHPGKIIKTISRLKEF